MSKKLKEFGDMNIFIDSSYVIYYTLYGAYNMWKKEYSDRYKQKIVDGEVPDLTLDDKYTHCLQVKYENNMDKIFNLVKNKLFGGFTPPKMNPIIYFVYDDKGSEYWRKKIYPEYKEQRKHQKKNFQVGAAFNYLTNIILPKIDIENYYGITLLKVDHAEADDIIMTLIRRMKHNNNVIIGTDHDYIQVLNNARMFDLSGNEIDINTISEKNIGKTGMTHDTYLLCKYITGDKSDNIQQVFPRHGYKTAWKLIHDKHRLIDKFKQVDGSMKKFKQNIYLIDCKKIPENIQRDIIKAYMRVKNG